MRERDLAARWFARLHDGLSLPPGDRTAAVEEIRAHVELAADEMVARGIPREVGVRQVLERLGAPERLARDITAAHRRPLDLLTAAGVAFRVTAVTAFRTLVLAWTALALLAIALGVGVEAMRRVIGSQFLRVDWSPILDGFIPAAVGALVAFVVGRSLVTPVAIAAHRSRSDVRGPVLVVGMMVAALIGLTGVEARWSVPTAMAMATLPAWYALGILRPAALPSPDISARGLIGVAVLILVMTPLVLVGVGGQMSSGSSEPAEFDPDLAYAAVGAFVDIENPPLEITEGTDSLAPWVGPGPIRIERSGKFVSGHAAEWGDLRLEVWQGPEDQLNGHALDPQATEPLASSPMTVTGSRVHGTVTLLPEPRDSFYYVAVTGRNEAGERVQLAWPGVEWWQWRGTTLQFFAALTR